MKLSSTRVTNFRMPAHEVDWRVFISRTLRISLQLKPHTLLRKHGHLNSTRNLLPENPYSNVTSFLCMYIVFLYIAPTIHSSTGRGKFYSVSLENFRFVILFPQLSEKNAEFPFFFSLWPKYAARGNVEFKRISRKNLWSFRYWISFTVFVNFVK